MLKLIIVIEERLDIFVIQVLVSVIQVPVASLFRRSVIRYFVSSILLVDSNKLFMLYLLLMMSLLWGYWFFCRHDKFQEQSLHKMARN